VSQDTGVMSSESSQYLVHYVHCDVDDRNTMTTYLRGDPWQDSMLKKNMAQYTAGRKKVSLTKP